MAGILGSLVMPTNLSIFHQVRPKPIEICVADDGLKNNNYQEALAAAVRDAAIGATCVRITEVWVTGQTSLNDIDYTGLKNAEAAAQDAGLNLEMAAYPCPREKCSGNATPTRQWERGKFTNWLAWIIYHSTVNDYTVGNEPNTSYFWANQDNPGKDYERLLASSYDAAKKAGEATGRNISVAGGATAARGTTSTLDFIAQMGQAYRDSFRQKPIMDAWVHHPYPDNSSQAPSVTHQSNNDIGVADYPKMVTALGRAFDGTAQAGSKLPIIYGEFGVQTIEPANKLQLYSGSESVNTLPVTEATQVRYYIQAMGMAACQPNVTTLTIFEAKDEQNLNDWQSGLYYTNGQPKSSAKSFAAAAAQAANGSLVSSC